SIAPSWPPRAARSRTRSRTGRWDCPAGWTTCPAGSAPPGRSPTSRGRWRGRGARTVRICGLMAPTSGRGWGGRGGGGGAAVGRGAGVRVHASHLWGGPDGIEAAFRAADAAGVGVSYDMYPYRRSSTILASLLLPPDLQARGPERTLAALADPRERAALLAG